MKISHFSGKFFFGIMLCLGLSVTDAVAQDYYEDHKKGDPYRFEEPDGFVWYKDVKNGAVQGSVSSSVSGAGPSDSLDMQI